MNTKEMIAVMQAYEDGKQIEFREHTTLSWLTIGEPAWDWSSAEYRIKATKKVVDLSVLIDSGIDCVMGDTLDDKVIGPLTHIDKCSVDEPYWDDINTAWTYCRPRMNHIHAWQGGDCPLPFNTMVRIHYRDYVRANESYVKRAGDCYWEHRKEPHGLDIIAFEVIGLADGYCYPWECDE